jgi:hypothetical protein
MKTINYSKETRTVIEIFEGLPANKRKHLLEKIQDMNLEQESESNWDNLLESSPDPMIKMAKNALKEHKSGHSKPTKI